MKIEVILLGQPSILDDQEVRDNNIPVLTAFLDSDDVAEITLVRSGTGFVPVTYRKIDAHVSVIRRLAKGLSQ